MHIQILCIVLLLCMLLRKRRATSTHNQYWGDFVMDHKPTLSEAADVPSTPYTQTFATQYSYTAPRAVMARLLHMGVYTVPLDSNTDGFVDANKACQMEEMASGAACLERPGNEEDGEVFLDRGYHSILEE